MDKIIEFKLGVAFDLIVVTSDELDLKKWRHLLKANPKKPREYHAYPYLYSIIVQKFKQEGFTIKSDILRDSNFSPDYAQKFNLSLSLRDYQKEALAQFMKNKGR
ncbi:MAG: hypothetical protein ACTSPI_16800, partial [Candidatus Heimdallarchaeaceae archaeon]